MKAQCNKIENFGNGLGGRLFFQGPTSVKPRPQPSSHARIIFKPWGIYHLRHARMGVTLKNDSMNKKQLLDLINDDPEFVIVEIAINSQTDQGERNVIRQIVDVQRLHDNNKGHDVVRLVCCKHLRDESKRTTKEAQERYETLSLAMAHAKQKEELAKKEKLNNYIKTITEDGKHETEL